MRRSVFALGVLTGMVTATTWVSAQTSEESAELSQARTELQAAREALEAAALVSQQRKEAGHPGVREPAVPFVPAK